MRITHTTGRGLYWPWPVMFIIPLVPSALLRKLPGV